MLAKEFRLKRSDFDPLGKFSGKPHPSSNFFFVTRSNSVKHYKVGVIISKKIYSNAVDRNRLRRQVYNFFHKTLDKDLNQDILVIFNPKVKTITPSQLFEELTSVLKNLKLLT